MQAEDQRGVDGGDRVDGLAELLDLQALRDLVVVLSRVVVEGEGGLEDVVAEPLHGVGVEELAVQVVGDAAAVLGLVLLVVLA